MAVVAVIITAPLGAILTNTLGIIWLSEDPPEPKIKNFGSIPPGKSLDANALIELKMGVKKTSEFGTSMGLEKADGFKKGKETHEIACGDDESVD